MKLHQVVFSGLVAGLLVASGPVLHANEPAKEASAAQLNTQSISGKLVAAKTDEANKATAFDVQTSDGKIYHVTFDEKAAPAMTTDLGALIDQEVELTGEISTTEPLTIKVSSFRKLTTEKAPS